MNNAKQKYCPRCGAAFECIAAAIQECRCSSVFLKDTALTFLKKNYPDCLCVNCLEQIGKEFKPGSSAH